MRRLPFILLLALAAWAPVCAGVPSLCEIPARPSYWLGASQSELLAAYGPAQHTTVSSSSRGATTDSWYVHTTGLEGFLLHFDLNRNKRVVKVQYSEWVGPPPWGPLAAVVAHRAEWVGRRLEDLLAVCGPPDSFSHRSYGFWGPDALLYIVGQPRTWRIPDPMGVMVDSAGIIQLVAYPYHEICVDGPYRRMYFSWPERLQWAGWMVPAPYWTLPQQARPTPGGTTSSYR
jgi:hypothetical protein